MGSLLTLVGSMRTRAGVVRSILQQRRRMSKWLAQYKHAADTNDINASYLMPSSFLPRK